MIFCSEKCLHEADGLCTLKEVTNPSSTPIRDCPYFKEKSKKEGTSSSAEEIPPFHL
jgi:hypothetical protein